MLPNSVLCKLFVTKVIENFDKAYVVIILSSFSSQSDLLFNTINTCTYISDMAACVLISKHVELSPSHVLNIESPGYPDVNYKNDTVLIWNVTAPATTEEIFIVVHMDIIKRFRGKCEDYLQVIFPKRNKVVIIRLHVLPYCFLINVD